MKSEGYGGRAGNNQFSESVIEGLIDLAEKPPSVVRECKNPKCRRFFLSRQEGDDYCTDKCDSRFRGKGNTDQVNSGNDPSWDNAVRINER